MWDPCGYHMASPYNIFMGYRVQTRFRPRSFPYSTPTSSPYGSCMTVLLGIGFGGGQNGEPCKNGWTDRNATSRRDEMCRKKFFKTFLNLLLSCSTSFLNQENTGLLHGSGPMRNIIECSLVQTLNFSFIQYALNHYQNCTKHNYVSKHNELLERSFSAILAIFSY